MGSARWSAAAGELARQLPSMPQDWCVWCRMAMERDTTFSPASAAVLPESDALILAVLRLIDQSVVHAENIDYNQAWWP